MDRGTGTAAVRLVQQQRDVVWELGVYTRGPDNSLKCTLGGAAPGIDRGSAANRERVRVAVPRRRGSGRGMLCLNLSSQCTEYPWYRQVSGRLDLEETTAFQRR